MTVLIYILLCLLWGSTWLAIKIGLTDAPPLTTAAVRFLIALAVLFTIARIGGLKFPSGVKSLAKLGYPGIYMYGASYALVYFAEQHIDSGMAAVLFAVYPFFVALLSWVMYRTEKLSLIAWLGMAVGFVGVVIISLDSLKVSGDLFLGTVLAVVAPLTAAYGIVIHKRYHSKENIVVAASVQMTFGGTLLVLGALLFEDISAFNFTAASVGSILYLAVPGSVVTFLGYYWLLKRIRLTTASLIAFITPLVAIMIGVSFAGESLSLPIMTGAVLILSGVLLVIKK